MIDLAYCLLICLLYSISLFLRFSGYFDSEFTLFQRKKTDMSEGENTYETLYDDELLELMAKYDEMDKQHKKEKGEY